MTNINGFDIDGFMFPSEEFNSLNGTSCAFGGWYEYDNVSEGHDELAGFGFLCDATWVFDYTQIVRDIDGEYADELKIHVAKM